MRCLLKARIPLQNGNDLVFSGRIKNVMKNILEDIRPETVYFVEEEGNRTVYAFVDIPDPSKIPAFVEPFFLGLNATVEIHPAFNLQEMEKAGPDLEQLARRYAQQREPVLAR